MDVSGSSSAALDALRGQFDRAMIHHDTVRRFRALQTVHLDTRKLHTKLTMMLRDHEKDEAELEAEKRFLTKHEVKLELLAQSLYRCYQSPGKARETLDHLCLEYGAKYALNVVRIGIWRLARPVGFDLLGIKSEARRIAEQFFETALLPMLEQIIPYHADYLKLKRLDVEERYDQIQHEIETGRKAIAMVDAAIKKYRKELETAAMSMTEEEVADLSSEETAERMTLLPTKMREAILEARREAIKKPPGAL